MTRAKPGAKPPAKATAARGDDVRWAAVVARDKAFDGKFVTAVATTGIYCRPSCAARRPLRENVRFHATCAQAEAAGFRACKRCTPNAASREAQQAAKVTAACRLIETAETPPKLEELAADAGMSPYHFHRVFKAVTGVTPKAYAVAHRHNRVRNALRGDKSVTEAIYAAGFNSSGRFYAGAGQALGMTPRQFRAGGANAEISFATAQCSLGTVLVAASAKGLCSIMLGDDEKALVRELAGRFAKAQLLAGDRQFAALLAKVVAFIEAPRKGLDLPLDVRGTAFQHRVWMALRDIPAGKTASYAEIAKRIGKPDAVRAVAGACAANKLAVAIPCHRVVRSDGSLSGYRWGEARKRALLDKERG
jgi:AraC family transcriptional regulator of adaptative response/methylated-DNA-[protein]-cysteine methyltransferase